MSEHLKRAETQRAILWENCWWTRNELFGNHSDAFQSLRNMLLGPEQALVPEGIRDLDEPGCAVVSAPGRQSREQDRKLEGAGRDDFGSVTPRSPL